MTFGVGQPRASAGQAMRLTMLALAWAGSQAVQAQPAAQAVAAPTSAAVDWALAAGAGSHQRVDKLGLIAGWGRPAPLWQGERWRLVLHHEVELAAWRVPSARDLIEMGYSPVFRLERPLGGRAVWFFEGAIGARLLSHTRVAPGYRLSTAFQFSDMLGVGLRWGRAQRATIGLRVQHLSNLGIKRPNPGMEFLQLYAAYRF